MWKQNISWIFKCKVQLFWEGHKSLIQIRFQNIFAPLYLVVRGRRLKQKFACNLLKSVIVVWVWLRLPRICILLACAWLDFCKELNVADSMPSLFKMNWHNIAFCSQIYVVTTFCCYDLAALKSCKIWFQRSDHCYFQRSFFQIIHIHVNM